MISAYIAYSQKPENNPFSVQPYGITRNTHNTSTVMHFVTLSTNFGSYVRQVVAIYNFDWVTVAGLLSSKCRLLRDTTLVSPVTAAETSTVASVSVSIIFARTCFIYYYSAVVEFFAIETSNSCFSISL